MVATEGAPVVATTPTWHTLFDHWFHLSEANNNMFLFVLSEILITSREIICGDGILRLGEACGVTREMVTAAVILFPTVNKSLTLIQACCVVCVLRGLRNPWQQAQ